VTFSRLERITICVTLLTAAFLCGWFLSRQHDAARAALPTALPSPVPTVSLSAPDKSKININTADAETLTTLPGIGQARARDIIAYREANGPFPIPEAITDVPGIGSATLKQILDYITVEE